MKEQDKNIPQQHVKFLGIRVKLFGQFTQFIKDYGVVGLAIGIVIGSAVTKYVNSIVENLISPLIGIIISSNTLSDWMLGPIKIGAFLTSTIEFLIVLSIIFFSVRYVLRFLKLVEDKQDKEIENKKK